MSILDRHSTGAINVWAQRRRLTLIYSTIGLWMAVVFFSDLTYTKNEQHVASALASCTPQLKLVLTLACL